MERGYIISEMTSKTTMRNKPLKLVVHCLALTI